MSDPMRRPSGAAGISPAAEREVLQLLDRLLLESERSGATEDEEAEGANTEGGKASGLDKAPLCDSGTRDLLDDMHLHSTRSAGWEGPPDGFLLNGLVLERTRGLMQVESSGSKGRYLVVVTKRPAGGPSIDQGGPSSSSSAPRQTVQAEPNHAEPTALGTDLLRDRPFAFVLTKGARLERCGGCGLVIGPGTGTPCRACPMVSGADGAACC